MTRRHATIPTVLGELLVVVEHTSAGAALVERTSAGDARVERTLDVDPRTERTSAGDALVERTAAGAALVARTAAGDALVEHASAGDALAGVTFEGHRHPLPADRLGVEVDAASDPVVHSFGVELGEYLAGSRTTFDLPLAPSGDEFQLAVWAMLRDIPYGATVTYGELAARLGDRNLARRVGNAVGRNPLSIVVPCHRVVGADGSLTGYAGGLERKRFLLELEGAPVVAQTRLF